MLMGRSRVHADREVYRVHVDGFMLMGRCRVHVDGEV